MEEAPNHSTANKQVLTEKIKSGDGSVHRNTPITSKLLRRVLIKRDGLMMTSSQGSGAPFKRLESQSWSSVPVQVRGSRSIGNSKVESNIHHSVKAIVYL